MSASSQASSARVEAVATGDLLALALAGTWRVTGPQPDWNEIRAAHRPARVRLTAEELGPWDSSLPLFVFAVMEWCRREGLECDVAGLPDKVRALLVQLADSHQASVPRDRSENFLTMVGKATLAAWVQTRDMMNFLGECVLGGVSLLKHPQRFRWRDCLAEMQQCGAMALPIVGLISFLVGLTMAYTGALVLRQFGGDIWVADIVGLSMVREMGAMMTGVVLAGRTGAAFAAHLANMKANEEIDALKTLGIAPMEFLVWPRLLALGAMMPMLTLYSIGLGILGGMTVALLVLEIPPVAYWMETLTIVDLSDMLAGLIKAGTFGFIVGMSGCWCGLRADRSSAGVGRAATSAVVTAILLIIVADALYAVIFNILGI